VSRRQCSGNTTAFARSPSIYNVLGGLVKPRVRRPW